MQIISSPQEMQDVSLKWRANGQKIVFVPTMGALHEGHLSLLREGRKLGDVLVLSIYVNPKQFAPTEDLLKYPHDKDGDLAKASGCGVDAVFFPSDEAMYPSGYQTYVEVTDVTGGLCGTSRPTHFRGVTTVVLKLLNIVQPHAALLGEKDWQQLVTIRTMVRDLNFPVEIVGVPTVREEDGLAMSSRNAYLSPDERISALSLSRALTMAQEMVKAGTRDSAKIITAVKRVVESEKLTKIDYVKICDPITLREVSEARPSSKLLIAAFAGKTRLIDNCGL